MRRFACSRSSCAFFFSSRRRHTRWPRDWSSDVCSSDLFPLGIPVNVTVTPIELTGGYRFDFGSRVVPYGGGGVSWYRYKETSRFATDAENVNERFNGYQILGGAEVRIWKWIAAAGEVQWASVPDALGQDPNGISREFNEKDLGGTTIRFKVVIGR